MKKILSVLIIITIFVSSLTVVKAADDITVLLDGNKIEFDVQPRIFDDFTFVPMRAIFEALGAAVEWDGNARSITSTKGDTKIFMVIDKGGMLVNGEFIGLEAPPRIVDDRTLVPVRAVAESFDCDVSWDAQTRMVLISTVKYQIDYDPSMEAQSSIAKDFNITSIRKNIDGNYEITYMVQTYRESSGNVTVAFDCYDAEGNRVDGFAGMFYSWAYTWTEQEGIAIISGKTTKIELADDVFSNLIL